MRANLLPMEKQSQQLFATLNAEIELQVGGTTFHNVAACNEQYVLVNQPKTLN